MVAVRVYVEGGGDTRAQSSPLREAVSIWIQRAVPEATRRPTIVACGPRRKAFEEFCRAVQDHPDAFCVLLVDSEGAVTAPSKWGHAKERDGDGWDRPSDTSEDNLHFMAQSMEAWLCADSAALGRYFGAGLNAEALPKRANLEEEPRADLNRKLARATSSSQRGEYRKGRDLGLLGSVSPALVQERCGHAVAFVGVLRKKLGGGQP